MSDLANLERAQDFVDRLSKLYSDALREWSEAGLDDAREYRAKRLLQRSLWESQRAVNRLWDDYRRQKFHGERGSA